MKAENPIMNASEVFFGHSNTARKTTTGKIYLSSLSRFALDSRNKCSIIIGGGEARWEVISPVFSRKRGGVK